MMNAEYIVRMEKNIDGVLLENDVVMIDTNILMDETSGAELFFYRLADGVRRTGRQICLMEDVLVEVHSHLTGVATKASAESHRRAVLADRRIRALLQEKLACVRVGGQKQCFFDAAVIALWLRDVQRKYALITSDNNLSRDLVTKLSGMKDDSGRTIQCYKINAYGFVRQFVDQQAAAPARKYD